MTLFYVGHLMSKKGEGWFPTWELRVKWFRVDESLMRNDEV